MEKIVLDLNHEADDLATSFGIPDEKRADIVGAMYYSFLYRQYLAESLFDEDKVPTNFNRKSNVIEDFLNDEVIENTVQQAYAAIEYGRFDARMIAEDKKMYMTLMVFDAKLAKLSYDKKKFLQWHKDKIMENED